MTPAQATSFSRLVLVGFLFATQAPCEGSFIPATLGIPLTDPSPDATPPPGADRPHGAVAGATSQENAGLQSGDLIVAYNGAQVESSQALKRMLAETPAGREVEIRVIRDGSPRLLRPRLRAAAPAPEPVQTLMPVRKPVDPEPRQLGARVLPLDPDIARHIGWSPGEGLQVAEVLDNSPAQKGDLRKGDLLLEIEGQSIRSPEHFLLVLKQSPRADVDLTVHRNGGRHTTFLRFVPESEAP